MNKDQNKFIRWFEDLDSEAVPQVGGKNASLGEMLNTLEDQGVRVPGGFATTAHAYRAFLDANDLEEKIKTSIENLNTGENSLQETGKGIRRLFRYAEFPPEIAGAIKEAYEKLGEHYDLHEVDVAVRSSATAEDLPEASFAGQQETFLNVSGKQELLEACRKCYASLFTDRAISYRDEQGFDHLEVALSVGVQKMVRSDEASSGVMFTIDTETGFPDVVVINGSWGLGENVVQGAVTPDEYRVFKPLLDQHDFVPIIEKSLGTKEKKMIYASGGSEATKNVETSTQERRSYVLEDDEILRLARWAVAIEDHYERPMDIEWAKDGESGDLFIVQARPETVQSQKEASSLKTYTLDEQGESLVTGLAIGGAIASGKVCVIYKTSDRNRFEAGSILVTGMTDPDWVPIMKQASGIITDLGGRTSHAAIVSRELGLPAVVGTGDATETLEDDQTVTLSCAEGEQGHVYEGELSFKESRINLDQVPETKTRIMMNIASPAAAFRWWRLPCQGIGLARMEFIINNLIKIHPLALVHYDDLEDQSVQDRITELTRGYDDKPQYFVNHLARGIAKIAAAQYPEPVIVRLSDFKTNEYADLIGGELYEPDEENPMLGFRGASRYYSEQYHPGFLLECQALKQVRELFGLQNVIVMVPFCRTLQEADKILEALSESGLKRGENDLEIYVMIEIPANIILAEEFAERFDGFSIGSNDLTQLILGVDRDSAHLAKIFDERNEAVKRSVADLLDKAHTADTPVGICGQAPSDFPEFSAFLVEHGIDSISLNPDSVIEVKKRVAQAEKDRK
jgi:pyruvate,water dikinase